jgi:cytochrome P450 family 12
MILAKRYRLYTSLVHADLQKKYGDLVVLKTPHPVVLVFAPEDHETVFKNEGKYPIALGFESLKYYRKNIRSDLYPQLGKCRADIVQIIGS